MADSDDAKFILDNRASYIVCQTSAAMVGVCLTGVGLLRIVISTTHSQNYGDDLLCVDAIGFLVATLTSYLSIRRRHIARRQALEMVADWSFVAAMLLLALDCFYITYVVTSI